MFADSIGDPRVMEGAFYVAANYPAYAATWWWKNNEMNKFVDRGNTVAQITKRVNGGYVKTLPSPSPTLWASRTHPSFSWLTRTLTRSTPSGPSRVGSKLPLPMYADLRNIDMTHHIPKVHAPGRAAEVLQPGVAGVARRVPRGVLPDKRLVLEQERVLLQAAKLSRRIQRVAVWRMQRRL